MPRQAADGTVRMDDAAMPGGPGVMGVMAESFDPIRAVGMAGVELRFAAAELRSAAAQPESGDRGLLYSLADRMEQAAERLQHGLEQLEAAEPNLGGGSS